MVPGERIATRNSHGTGCSLSSAMATVQARVGDWEAALREVKPWLLGALREASVLDVGTGNGPVHHFHHVQRLTTGQHGRTGHGPAEGEFAAALRAGAAADLDAIYGLEFIRGLADGTLPEHEFAYYLAQDAIYLNGYSRVLARAAAIAPTEAEQLFWARSAQTAWKWNPSCTGPGSAPAPRHRSWARSRSRMWTTCWPPPCPAATGCSWQPPLPCFWLYAEVGATLHRAVPGRRRTRGAPLRRLAADLRRRGLCRRDPAGHCVHGCGGPAGLRRASGRPWPWPSGSPSRYEVDFFDAPRLHA